MCGPKGTSLFVKKEHQKWIKPIIYSWGKNGDDPESSEFLQNFQWQGTRDMSAFLTVPKIIEFYNVEVKRSRANSRQIILDSQNNFTIYFRLIPFHLGMNF